MARNGVHIRNIQAVAQQIEALAKAGGEEMVSGIRTIGEMVMTDVRSSRPGAGVPKKDGILASSGRVTGPEPSDPVVRLTFGGAAAPYALRQHEELNYRHTLGEARYLVRGIDRFKAGGGPKKALKEMADAAIQAVARRKGSSGAGR